MLSGKLIPLIVLMLAPSVIPEGTLAAPGDTLYTFNRDIAPIIFEHCTPCHRQGQVAPFALERYADIKKRASFVAEVVSKHIMPPWKPVGERGLFIHSRELDDSLINKIIVWVQQGAREGSGRAPQPPAFASNWQLGRPDLILEMKDMYEIPAGGNDLYAVFRLPVSISEARYVRAVEIRPSNPQVVHHILAFADTGGVMAQMFPMPEAAPPGLLPPAPFFTGWSPGTGATEYSDGSAKKLTARSTIFLQTHFHPTGKSELERTKIGIYFAEKPPKYEPFDFTVSVGTINIPPWTNHLIRSSFVTPADVYVTAIFPHAHYIAHEITAQATPFGHAPIEMIHINDWDMNWQGQYRYQTPVFLPKNTRIDLAFWYANTEDNPRNPNSPPKRVKYGPNSTDEMGTMTFEAYSDDPKAAELFESAVQEKLKESLEQKE